MEPVFPFLIAFNRRRRLDELCAGAEPPRVAGILPGWERLTVRWRNGSRPEDRRRMRPAPELKR